MLKLLRKKGVMKKMLWFVAIVIIVTFGFFGTASLLDNAGKASAGKIFGKSVPMEDFQKTYAHTRNQAIMQYGDNFFKIQQFLDLESETWDRLILLAEAKKRRIKASNKEVIETIKSQPFFLRDGKFDRLLYNDILRYVFKSKPRLFEEGMRESIKIQKLFEQQTILVSVSDEDILNAYKNENEKIQVNYVPFNTDQYKKDVTLTENEIRDYYEINKNDFRVPPMINVEFMNLPLPEDADFDKKNQTAATANLISMELKLTPNLGEVGQKYDLLVQESGYFSEEKPNLKLGWSFEILKIVFGLKKGEISGPVETAQGYYFLKVKDKKDSYIPEFKEAMPKAKEVIATQKANQIAKEKTQEALSMIKEELAKLAGQDFSAVARSLGFRVEQTPVFNRGQYLPTIGIAKEFQEAAFSLNEADTISGVVEISNGYAILNLQSYIPIDEKKFQEERNTFAESLIAEKRTKAFNDFLTRLRTQAKLKSNLPSQTKQQ